MTGIFQDVKFALRMITRSPWFSFVLVLTLALGIGVNSAGFSIANGLPIPQSSSGSCHRASSFRSRSRSGYRYLIIARLDIPYSTYGKDPERVALMENFVERFQRPDRPTSFAWRAPLEGAWVKPLQIEDHDVAAAAGKLPDVGMLPIGNDYFRTLNIKMTLGRDLNAWDGRPGSEVAIVNERFARTYWPSESPLGKRLRLGDEKSPWLTVVGVSPNALQAWSIRSGEVRPLIYVPHRLIPVGPVTILVHSAQTEFTVRELREELTKIDPDLAPFDVVQIDGKKGYIATRFVRSSIDYRARFRYTGGRWWLVFFVAGD